MVDVKELVKLGKEIKLLYVEDDKRLQEENIKVFSKIFMHVDSANNGKEGIQRFESSVYDLVITDIEMPVMDGLAMSQAIKTLSLETPIIVISAYSETDYLLDAIEYGVDFFVLKPTHTDKLLQTLYKACKQIEDKKMAQRYETQQVLHQIQMQQKAVVETISNHSPNASMLFINDTVEFVNEKFKKNFKPLVKEDGFTYSMLLDYFETIAVTQGVLIKSSNLQNQLLFNEENSCNIALHTAVGKRAFSVVKTPIDEERFLLTFSDITQLILQAVQLEDLNRQIDTTIKDKFTPKSDQERDDIIDKVNF
jgi:YesN/AraC family two-component response regulator